MRKLTYSFPAKVAAVFALVISALVTAVFGITTAVAYSARFYALPSYIGSYDLALDYLLESGYIGRSGYDYLLTHYSSLIDFVFRARYSAIALTAAGAVIFILLFIFLICAAGLRAEGNRYFIKLSFFSKIPFDIVFLAVAAAELFLLSCQIELTYSWLVDDVVIMFIFMAAIGVIMLLLLLSVLYTFSARVKAGGWWRNTVIFMLLRLIWRMARSFGLWLRRLFRAIPMVWRVSLIVAAYIVLVFVMIGSRFWYHDDFMEFTVFFLFLAAGVVVILGAAQMRALHKAAKELASGNLDYKVDTKRLYFDFKRHAENLNSIGDGLSAAVDQRMRSERMKTELITNVSHDIKTPLTSIINYVDLLQKAHTPEEEAQYLDVLKRQSEKLRRLTLDLVEASKASTGNLPTELAPTNSSELINQAVAEYADRFEQGRLEPIVILPEKPITVLADGRHLWRVLDNLFNNAVKYAQPDTRVYIEARRLDGEAVISVKNISRDRLNVSSDELMERFVRGDESRHTEGSGLGLSIARSLTELMEGSFGIRIDGDLFKAEITLKVI